MSIKENLILPFNGFNEYRKRPCTWKRWYAQLCNSQTFFGLGDKKILRGKTHKRLTYLTSGGLDILDVLVVAVGATGLTLVAVLKSLGISVKIIELKSTLSDTSKTTNLMQGTQEHLAIFICYNLCMISVVK
jgi:hypothetical protein